MTFVKTVESYHQGARTMPREFYTSPAIHAEEVERIFTKSWHCVGRAERLATPGDYFLQSIAGESLIMLTDRHHVIHAYYNVCRHRGTRMCDKSEGHFSETIQCPYHAWTWTTDGRLIGAPHMNEIEGFDKSDYPLHQAAVHEWEGFLFVSLAPEPEPFARAFAPLLNRFDRFELASLKAGKRIRYEAAANWKLVFQNFSECLHCPMIHPQLASKMPYLSGENDLTEGPFLGGYMVIGAPNESLTVTGRSCGLPVGQIPESDRQRAYYYSIMPNLLLSFHPDYVNYYMVWPDGPRRTIIETEWLFNPTSFGRADFNPDDAINFWDTTNRQDWRISELSQAGIESRVYAPGPYSPRESVPAAWDRAYRAIMGR